MRLSLGFSTCPNDTFIFDALVHGKVDTEGLEFDVKMADIEELNKKALADDIDITKISCFAFAHVSENYLLLNSGSALGRGNGPLLIARKKYAAGEIGELTIAIPGKMTTANFLFSIFYPEAKQKKELIFSEIENAILGRTADAGVIIHESRFTYQAKGLVKIADLGEKWEESTGYPIPLGGIAISKKLSREIQVKVDRVLRKSVEFALANPMSGIEFIRANARELDDDVIRKHISLYVNDFTVDLGIPGKNAMLAMFEKASKAGIINSVTAEIFV